MSKRKRDLTATEWQAVADKLWQAEDAVWEAVDLIQKTLPTVEADRLVKIMDRIRRSRVTCENAADDQLGSGANIGEMFHGKHKRERDAQRRAVAGGVI